MPVDVDGWTVGLLCAIGYEPETLAPEQLIELKFLAYEDVAEVVLEDVGPCGPAKVSPT